MDQHGLRGNMIDELRLQWQEREIDQEIAIEECVSPVDSDMHYDAKYGINFKVEYAVL